MQGQGETQEDYGGRPMNFEDAYKKLRDGTATDEEAAFVARELENVRRISSILDNPELSDHRSGGNGYCPKGQKGF